MLPRLISLKTAAEMLGLTRMQLYRAIARGELAYVRPSGKATGAMWVTEAAIEAWLARHTVPATVPTPILPPDPAHVIEDDDDARRLGLEPEDRVFS